MPELLVRVNFVLTYTLSLKNGTFLTRIPLPQNLKVEGDFSKIEVRLKALSVRF